MFPLVHTFNPNIFYVKQKYVNRVHHVKHVKQAQHHGGICFNKSGDINPIKIQTHKLSMLMVRLIEAFPVKMELHIVDGYVYQYKRAAGGAARFLNYLRNQLEQKIRHVQHVDLVNHGRRVWVGLGVVRAIEPVNGKNCVCLFG
jgi:hypothetical protein